VVFRLEMLSPTTLMASPKLFNPLKPLYMAVDKDMYDPLLLTLRVGPANPVISSELS
jgi:hypothetical protein